MDTFDLSSIEVSGSTGLDAALGDLPGGVVRKAHRVRVASVQDLKAFDRLSAETLIHKSTRDLWTLSKDADGGFSVERVFDGNGPLKG